MSITETAGTVEVTELESWLEGECGCEVEHVKSVCSIEVTHLSIAKCEPGVHYRVCLNAFKLAEGWAKTGVTCHNCDAKIADCWSHIPI